MHEREGAGGRRARRRAHVCCKAEHRNKLPHSLIGCEPGHHEQNIHSLFRRRRVDLLNGTDLGKSPTTENEWAASAAAFWANQYGLGWLDRARVFEKLKQNDADINEGRAIPFPVKS